MIINQELEITINASNFKHYSKFYQNLKNGMSIMVKVAELTKYSNSIIQVKCDNCDVEKQIRYKDYISYGYTLGEYLCRKCKTKKNNLKKWGVENVFQSIDIKEKIKKTNILKYGVDNISKLEETKNKVKETSIIKYGVEHYLQQPEVKEQLKKSNIQKWGVDNVSKLPEIKNKKVQTCLKNHGVEYIFMDSTFKKIVSEKNFLNWGNEILFKSEAIKNKIKETNRHLYGAEVASKNSEVKNKIKKSVTKTLNQKTLSENPNIVEINSNDRTFNVKCEHCNNIFTIGYFLFYKRRETKSCICVICNPIDKHQSGLEIELQNFIKQIYNGEVLFNHKINSKELDIFIPEKSIAFEFDGLYWHSEIFKSKNFHLEKTELCKHNNITLYHIWEDDWLYKLDLIKSMIKNKLGLTSTKIWARNCEIYDNPSQSEIVDFLQKNHIQGYAPSTHKICLKRNNEILSIMCFRKCKEGFELNRFCSKIDTNVIGAASKLLNFFVKKYQTDIVTFSDNCYSNGNLYYQLKFEKLYDLQPDYYLVDSGVRVHKFNYRNKDVSGLFRIYDSGKVKYRLKISKTLDQQ